MIPEKTDQYWIDYALNLAKKAEAEQEVPVGAVIVYDNKLIAEGWNQPIQRHDPTAHAEIVAIRNAANKLNNYRLTNCTLYVTLEPCVMCVGAIIHARIKRLVFGALDPKAGAVQSVFPLIEKRHFNHRVEWSGGVCAEDCGSILKAFFKRRRL